MQSKEYTSDFLRWINNTITAEMRTIKCTNANVIEATIPGGRTVLKSRLNKSIAIEEKK